MAGFSSIIEGCRNIYCDSPPFKGGILFKTDSLAGILKGDTEIDKARRRSMKLLMDGNMLLDVLQKK